MADNTVFADQDMASVSTEKTSVIEETADSVAANGNSAQPKVETDKIEKVDAPNDSDKDEEGAKAAEGNKEADIDMFAYTKDGKFTSEIFKIEISNLPYRVGFGQLKKRLTSIGLKPVKVKMVDSSGNAFITFRNDEERDDAITKCIGHKWKGKTWTAKKALPAADPLAKKRKLDSEKDSGPHEKQAKIEEQVGNPVDRLNDAVTPLHKLPYGEQLQSKQDDIKAYLKKLSRDIQYNNTNMAAYLSIQRSMNNGLICPLDPIKPSPQVSDYRNKCEFTIGKSPSGEDNTVGFRLGRYNKGIITVVEVDSCVHVPASMKTVTKVLQKYLRGTSKYSAYDPEERMGHWRQITLRTNQQGAIMMMVAFHPQALSKEEVAAEREQLGEYFKSGEGSHCDVTSMYFIIETDRISDPKQNEHLFGEKHIEEELLGVRFRISPAAFFQVNTKAAEVLYKTVAEWSCVSPETILLDVCCGTGTIGLTMAKLVKRTMGVELCAEAVEDAKVNTGLNDIKNADFYCSKAEQFLPSYIRGLHGVAVVAVVDPPRGGLHPDVVRAIRKCALIKRVVYVSCNANGAKQNIVDFTRLESKRMQGNAFRLVRAVAVDMFPHTPHCELIMMLDREETVKEATDAVKRKQKEAREEAAAADKQTQDSTKTQTVTQGTSESKPTTQDTSESKPTTQDTSESKPTTQDTSETKPTTQDISESKPTTQDTSKTKPTTQDTSESKPTTQDTSETKPTTQDTSESKTTTEEAAKDEETKPTQEKMTESKGETAMDTSEKDQDREGETQ